MAHSVTGRKLVEQIETEILGVEVSLGHGGATDFANYQYQVGLIEGMRKALVILDDIEGKD